MDGCLLCLAMKSEFVDSIVIDSEQWHELNVNIVLKKYLWPMNHISSNSWICASCWRELRDFHSFYVRIEEVHKCYGLIEKNVTEIRKYDINTKSLLGGLAESPVNVIEESGGEDLKQSSVNELQDSIIMRETALQANLSIEERVSSKPELLQESLINNSPFGQKRKRGRPCKNATKNIPETALNNTRKCRTSKIIHISSKNGSEKTQDDSETHKNDGEIRNGNGIANTNIISASEEPELPSDSDGHSNDKADGKLYHSDVKFNNTQKVDHSEKDLFLAENFKITCFRCNIPFETFFGMRKHFDVHHTERGHVKCCNKKFYRRSILVDHVHYHLNPNYFKCEQCGKSMADRRCLELHIKTHEGNGDKNHCCDICGKGFAVQAVLKKHRMIHLSEEEKRFSCSDCGKNFASNYLVSSHYRSVHLKKYAKICDICGKSIRCKDVFERHMLQHEGKTAPAVSCDICGLLLTDKKALKRHKSIIHPVDGHHEYTCSICSKISPNLRAHKRHVAYKHVMGYDHKCTICNKAFKRAPALKEHMASHTGKSLYTCPWCPRTFNSNANMHNHRKKIHPKEWEEASRKRYSGNLPPNFKPPTVIDSTDFNVPLDI